MLPRILSAACHSFSSKPRLAPFPGFLTSVDCSRLVIVNSFLSAVDVLLAAGLRGTSCTQLFGCLQIRFLDGGSQLYISKGGSEVFGSKIRYANTKSEQVTSNLQDDPSRRTMLHFALLILITIAVRTKN